MATDEQIGLEQIGPVRSGIRILLAGLIVLAGLSALIGAVAIVLHHFPVVPASGGHPGEDRSSAAVAVLTPLVAGIAGIVGLYFGISATGSAKGQQVQTTAKATHAATESAASATETASKATETAQPAVAIASQVAAAISNGH